MNRERVHAAIDALLDAILDVPIAEAEAPKPRKPAVRVRAIPTNVDELARQRARRSLKSQGFA